MHLILFGTSGCHLCEQAEVIINACVPDGVEAVDIAEQEQWQERYAIRIPVLYDPETKQELGWPFGQAEVENFINRVWPACSGIRNIDQGDGRNIHIASATYIL